MQQEIMALYKTNNVNPFGGCLPMFLQMPIIVSLIQVLWRSISFKGAHFLWIKDLSEPDKLYKFPSALPIFGEYLNILPIIAAIFMLFQQKINSRNMVVTDPNQATQQKMMSFFFPILIGFIFYHFASGLNLYWAVFYCLTTVAQLIMAKRKR
jgi:YidC/Oxa1 family membrane protein insertase